MKFKLVFRVVVVWVLLGWVTGIAAAQTWMPPPPPPDACRMAAAKADTDIRAAYMPKIDFLLRVAAGLTQKGLDPTRYPQPMPGGRVDIINIPFVVNQLAMQMDSGLRQVFDGFQRCQVGFAPYQYIASIGTFFVTGGLSAVLPQSVTYIDTSRILGGTPFGGPGALIPKTRDDILNNLGIGGDVAKVIRNPVCIFGC